ncbi:MAG: VWA domain-containing protein [Vicinamibacterales bacterium]
MTRILPVLVVLAVAVVAAQEPVFRGDARLVRVDVSVLDAKKQPVRDLTAADFRVTERGKVLSVQAFQMIVVPADNGPRSGAQADGPEPGDRGVPVTSSAAEGTGEVTSINPGRLIVLVMDDGMTPLEPRWMAQAKKITRSIVKGMGPNDRMALQFTRAGTTRLELTTDKSALLAAVERFDPGGFLALPPTRPSWADEEPRYWRTLSTIQNTVDAVGPLTDRQKMIVYVGPGIPQNGDLFRARDALHRAAQRANVVIYTFDPTGLDTLEDYVYEKVLLGGLMAPRPDGRRPLMSDLMQVAQAKGRSIARETNEFSASLAENTNGRASIRSDIFEPAVAQMFADTSVYYLIAVAPPTAVPDGKFHEVTVTINRPGVEVRSRRGYHYHK